MQNVGTLEFGCKLKLIFSGVPLFLLEWYAAQLTTAQK